MSQSQETSRIPPPPVLAAAAAAHGPAIASLPAGTVEGTTTMVVTKAFNFTHQDQRVEAFRPGVYRDVPLSVANHPYVRAHLEGAPASGAGLRKQQIDAAQAQLREELRRQIVAEFTPDVLNSIKEEVIARLAHEMQGDALQALIEKRNALQSKVDTIAQQRVEALPAKPVTDAEEAKAKAEIEAKAAADAKNKAQQEAFDRVQADDAKAKEDQKQAEETAAAQAATGRKKL